MKNVTKKSMGITATALLVTGLATAPMAFAQDTSTHQSAAQTHDSDQPITDTWITTKVKASLLAGDGVPGTDISVETVNGVVILSGEVESAEQVERAIEITEDIEGVIEVQVAQLRVVPTHIN